MPAEAAKATFQFRALPASFVIFLYLYCIIYYVKVIEELIYFIFVKLCVMFCIR